MIALSQPNQSLSPFSRHDDTRWLRFFDPRLATAAVAAHVAALPSSRTAEKHTQRVYEDGLRYFLDWMGMRLPTADLMQAYIAHLTGRNLKPSTIASKYLAPARLFLTKLAGQRIVGFTGDDRDYISDCRDHLKAALAVKSPRADTTSNVAPLWRAEFVRLSTAQVNAVLRAIDRATVIGSRDYALLHIAFSTGLRLAELQRITPASFKREGDIVLITVRGKRSNVDPVPVSPRVYEDVIAYINAFNADLEADDPRRLNANTPLWQPMLHGDHHPRVGSNGYKPDRGMSQQALRQVIARRTASVLGEDYALAAHDTRRTAAAIAYDAGMPLTDIQKLLRHKDAAVTLRYIGTKPDFAASTLANYVQFG